MADAGASDAPIAAAAGTDGAHATDAFATLGNEVRLATLLALWEAYDPADPDAVVSFSDLREAVGAADSGGFNYHLRQLSDTFLRKTDEGYGLSPVGLKLVQTVIAGAGRDLSSLDADVDVACPFCGGDTALIYRNGWLYHVCRECDGGFTKGSDAPDGLLFSEPFPEAALADRTPEELYAVGVTRLVQSVATKLSGLCTQCASAIDATVHVCDDHDAGGGDACSACGNAAAARVVWVCPVCKYSGGASPSGAAIGHSDVVAFYHDHGVDVHTHSTDFEAAHTVLESMRAHGQEVVSADPVRVRVTVRADDEELRLVFDDSLAVVDSDRRSTR